MTTPDQTGGTVMPSSHRVARPLAIAIASLRSAAAASQTATTGATTELSEVVVTGTRAALVESLDRKKGAKIVQDSIVAEDLGRFPDDNVADSLSHITGITVQR